MNKRFWVLVIVLLLMQAVLGYFGIFHLLPVNYSLLAKNTTSISIESLVTALFSLLVYTLNTVLTDYHEANLELQMDKLKKFNEKIDREIGDVLKDNTEVIEAIREGYGIDAIEEINKQGSEFTKAEFSKATRQALTGYKRK